MRTVFKNLRIAFPEKTALELRIIMVRYVFYMLKNLIWWFRLDKLKKEQLRRLIIFEPSEGEVMDLVKDRPLMFCTAHLGNWELANIVAEYYGRPYGVLVKKQKGLLANWLSKKRHQRSITIWYVGSGEKKAIREADKKAIGIVIDHGAKTGIPIKFFSKGCFFPKGVIWFAKKVSAKILLCFLVYERGRLKLRVTGPFFPKEVSEVELAEQLTDELQKAIHCYPEQYLWSFKRWKYSWDIKICLLKDTRAGHIRQSQALVEYIREAFPERQVEVTEISIGELVSLRKRWIGWIVNLLPMELAELLISKLFPTKKELLLDRYYDIVVSAGSSMVGINLFLKRYNQAKNVVIMNPGLFFRRACNLIIAPEHDRLKGKNVVNIFGALSFFDEGKAKKLAEKLKVPEADISVFIGGPIKGYRIGKPFQALIELLINSSKRVLITTSRRSPKWIEQWLESKASVFDFLVIASKYNPEGVVPAFLVQSRGVCCSADSISMISEALIAGKPVAVWFGDNNISGKHRKFLSSLIKKAAVYPLYKPSDVIIFLNSLREHSQNNSVLADKLKENLSQNLKTHLGF